MVAWEEGKQQRRLSLLTGGGKRVTSSCQRNSPRLTNIVAPRKDPPDKPPTPDVYITPSVDGVPVPPRSTHYVIHGLVGENKELARIMIDSGSHSQFVSTKFAQKHLVPQKLQQPFNMTQALQTPGAALSHVAVAAIDFDGQLQDTVCFVADISYDFILRAPWLERYKPEWSYGDVRALQWKRHNDPDDVVRVRCQLLVPDDEPAFG